MAAGALPGSVLTHAIMWILGGFALKTSGLLSETDGKVRMILNRIATDQHEPPACGASPLVGHAARALADCLYTVRATCRHIMSLPDLTPSDTSIATDLEGFAILGAVAIATSAISTAIGWCARVGAPTCTIHLCHNRVLFANKPPQERAFLTGMQLLRSVCIVVLPPLS